jgi:hypothetical protein
MCGGATAIRTVRTVSGTAQNAMGKRLARVIYQQLVSGTDWMGETSPVSFIPYMGNRALEGSLSTVFYCQRKFCLSNFIQVRSSYFCH